ncbi:MAG: M15 family metallopeptidase [Clostridia bacterium]|nr:M15 family metallopeptidase [Clostridia bacterium]
MHFSDWSKKQKILIGALTGVMLLLIILFAVLISRPASPVLDQDGPDSDDVKWIDEGVVSLDAQATPPPDLVLDFRADPDHPLPEKGAVLHLGDAYAIGGTVYSNYPIDAVHVSVSCAHNGNPPYPFRSTVHPSGAAGVYALTDAATEEGVSLSSLVDFTGLLVGQHTLKISVSVKGSRAVEVFRCTFRVVGDEWETITKESFPDSYPEALQFFGDESRFLYRFQRVNGRYILADPAWEDAYITSIPGYPDGQNWLVHIDAAPYFEKAFDYLDTSVLRVHGTNGDTGLIRASALITEYNGCYVSRFTSSLKAISHHSFGTAVDVNASMEPNKNNDANTARIDDDVKGHLTFNGILEADGVPYYDFTYDGAEPLDPNGVPETCVNYLLYELGFCRAGFDWAHYYKSTSDAMHFCLSEFVTYKHDDPQHGLQKVKEYAAPVDKDKARPAKDALPLPAPLPPASPAQP